MTLDLRSSERIKSIEKQFSGISSKLSSYIKKQTNLKECGKEVAISISNFASKEAYNETLKTAFKEFADILSTIQDYREAEIYRTQIKVIDGLSIYNQKCADLKGEVKKCVDARMKERKKMNELEKARNKNSPDWPKITQVEKDANQAQEEATRMNLEMMRQMKQFEEEKLEDLKKYFLEFIKIEMIFHCKAIELYTKSYNILKEINVEKDLQGFISNFGTQSPSKNSEDQPLVNQDMPKAPTEANEGPSSYMSYRPQKLNETVGTPRSVHTLRASVSNTVNSSTSSEGIFES